MKIDPRRAPSDRLLSTAIVPFLFGVLSFGFAAGCGDEGDDPSETGGSAGVGGQGGSTGNPGPGVGGAAGATAGRAGNAGAGGSAGSGGGAGTAGQGGKAGSGGTGGSAGTTGSGGSTGISGAAGAPVDGGRDAAGSGGGTGDGGIDGRVSIDAPTDAATDRGSVPGDGGVCTFPDPNDATITAYQKDITGRLSGQTEIATGIKLANRATVQNRQTTRDYLKKAFQDIGLTPMDHAYGSGTNVYATLPSTTGGGASVVWGAHYDSVMAAPGANDNATGVALVMAAARYATALPCRSKPLIFVLFDEEEVGLVGSKQFASKLKTDATQVHSVHTIDQMGWDNDGDRGIELELPDTGLRELYEAAQTKLPMPIPMLSTKTSSTDHSSFRPTFLAIGLTEEYTSGDTTPYYHKAGDTYDTVNFPYLLSTTVLVNQVIADLER